MIRRLFLMLLTLCLAAPAMTMPAHCLPAPPQQVASTAHHRHHQPAPPAQQVSAKHDCIGCIAPYAGVPTLATAMKPVGVARTRLAADPLAPDLSTPETPPPRS